MAPSMGVGTIGDLAHTMMKGRMWNAWTTRGKIAKATPVRSRLRLRARVCCCVRMYVCVGMGSVRGGPSGLVLVAGAMLPMLAEQGKGVGE